LLEQFVIHTNVIIRKPSTSRLLQCFLRLICIKLYTPILDIFSFFVPWSHLQPRHLHRFWHTIHQKIHFHTRMCLFGFQKTKSNIQSPLFTKSNVLGSVLMGVITFSSINCLTKANYLNHHYSPI